MSMDSGESSAMKALIDGSEPVDETLIDELEDLSKHTALHNKYSFWFHRRGHQANKSSSYEESIVKIASFQTVEHFWRIYDHIVRPNDVKTSIDYHVFKEGIKPTWEDPANKNGGKWMVRVRKGLTSTYWEDLLLAIIGEQFDVGHEICGAVLSVRNENDIISVWNKNADNTEATNKIRDQLRRILKLPVIVAIEYKKHQESLTDNSSYRNPTIVWRPTNNNPHYRNTHNPNHQNENYHRPGSYQGAPYQGNAATKPSAPPGVGLKDTNVAPKSSRWDALAPKTDGTNPTGQNKGWRQAGAPGTTGSWGYKNESGNPQPNSWSRDRHQHSSEIKIERESSGESVSGYVTAPDLDDSSSDRYHKGDNEQGKFKPTGWTKNQYRHQDSSESNQSASSGRDEGTTLSSSPPVSAPKPSAWRSSNSSQIVSGSPPTGGLNANAAPSKNKQEAPQAQEGRWSRAPK